MKQSLARANILKNESGFGSAFGLLFIFLFSTIFIITGFLRFTVDVRSDFRYFCFNDLHEIQKILLDHEERLMGLNPLAQALRLRLKILSIQLAAAIATKNAPLALQIGNWIAETKQQQKILRTQQQTLIHFGQGQAQYKLLISMKDLNLKNRSRSASWSEILNIQESISINTLRPLMAISPENEAEIAPVYRFNPDFENQQRITAFWTLWIFAKPSFQTLMKTKQTWSLKCISQPQNQKQLRPLVKADRL